MSCRANHHSLRLTEIIPTHPVKWRGGYVADCSMSRGSKMKISIEQLNSRDTARSNHQEVQIASSATLYPGIDQSHANVATTMRYIHPHESDVFWDRRLDGIAWSKVAVPLQARVQAAGVFLLVRAPYSRRLAAAQSYNVEDGRRSPK